MNKLYNEISQKENNNKDNTLDKDILINSMPKIISFVSTEKEELAPIRLIKAFFTSVYIYYQNKNSLLMELIEPYNSKKSEENDLANEKNIINKGNKGNKNKNNSIQDSENNKDKDKDKDNNKDEDDFIYKDPIPFEYDLKGASIEGRYSNIYQKIF
jgi:hypothetical protein